MTVAEYIKAADHAGSELTRLRIELSAAEQANMKAMANLRNVEMGTLERLKGEPRPSFKDGEYEEHTDAIAALLAGWDEQDRLMRASEVPKRGVTAFAEQVSDHLGIDGCRRPGDPGAF